MTSLQPRRPGSVSPLLFIALLSLICARPVALSMPQADESARTLRRFRAPEASQAVAVDRRFFYAIGNTVVAKYDKNTGAPVATWRAEAGSHIAHLNSGIVVGRELFCAHSNYPETPMVSSIEVFDTGRMTHRRSIPLTGEFGSATWIDRADGGWWVTFAHYAGKGGLPGKGPDATRLVRFSTDWKVRRVYAFPAAVVSRWEMMSSSGGIAVTPRVFATTGHDRPELYVVELPKAGDELVLRAIVPIESGGQGISVDRAGGMIYSIQRQTGEVLVSALPGSLRPRR